MEAKQRFVGAYIDLTTKERINFLMEHFGYFEQYHHAYRESIEERIACILSYERKKRENLGVRIMSRNVISDITAQKAMELVDIGQSIDHGKVSVKMIPDKDEWEEIMEAIYEWKLMRSEHEILKRQLRMLKPTDYVIMHPYLMREKTKRQIAKELEIESGSVDKRIYRIRRLLVNRVIPYLENGK